MQTDCDKYLDILKARLYWQTKKIRKIKFTIGHFIKFQSGRWCLW